MGKSGGRRKKSVNNNSPSTADNSLSLSNNTNSNSNGNKTAHVAANGVDVDSSIFLKRAHELKEEGNRRFQSKDYLGALEQYEQALKLTPKTHADRAVFHSNRAACLMQMKPVDYDKVIGECSLALQVQPQFGRALLRRARAFEALARYEMAMQDVEALLAADPKHRDALEIAQRVRIALGPWQEAQQDLQSRPSPAALGASAVRGAPIGCLGPCLPARPVPKKATAPSASPIKPEKLPTTNEDQVPSISFEPKAVSKPSNYSSEPAIYLDSKPSSSPTLQPGRGLSLVSTIGKWRPLKLVYDHDIRLAQMPVGCSFRVLRETVAKRFPSSKSVLIKYKDIEGDLVTITSTNELRLAESCLGCLALKEKPEGMEAEKNHVLTTLRLHIVEVSTEQEPALVDEEEEKLAQDDELIKEDGSASHSSVADSVLGGMETEIVKTNSEEEVPKKKAVDDSNNVECKEVEIDDWLFEFAQLFRTQVGIDPDAHIDLHELGMELCSEALEETVTSEEAQSLFDMAALKFQEVAALAFFNWGNVHMCAARKRIPLDESLRKELMTEQLLAAYISVQERYTLAGQKYEEALCIKPDFYEGLLALGQQHFETAKLQWSFAVANKVDLATWDSAETIRLFDSAEEKMKSATEMWERLEQKRANELKDPNLSKKDDPIMRKKSSSGTDSQSSGTGLVELSADEAAEQAAVMRSQIHLFWGNMLFERSQVEFKLGLHGWEQNLDAAVEKFKLAGASEADIAVVLKNHSFNGASFPGEDHKSKHRHS